MHFLCSSAWMIFKTRYNYWHMFTGKTLGGMLVMFLLFFLALHHPIPCIGDHTNSSSGGIPEVPVWAHQASQTDLTMEYISQIGKANMSKPMMKTLFEEAVSSSDESVSFFTGLPGYLTKPLWQVLVLSLQLQLKHIYLRWGFIVTTLWKKSPINFIWPRKSGTCSWDNWNFVGEIKTHQYFGWRCPGLKYQTNSIYNAALLFLLFCTLKLSSNS